MKDYITKFMSFVVAGYGGVSSIGSECWVWAGGVSGNGYGVFAPKKGTNFLAHRFSYEAIRGPIPAGLQLDHLCRVRACVNPSHLEAVTCRENLLRGETLNARNAAATHCPKGHVYDEENTYHGHHGRSCRECGRAFCREYQRKRRAALRAKQSTT